MWLASPLPQPAAEPKLKGKTSRGFGPFFIVIHLARLYCRKGNDFFLVDVPVKEAKNKRLELEAQGYVITHTEVV